MTCQGWPTVVSLIQGHLKQDLVINRTLKCCREWQLVQEPWLSSSPVSIALQVSHYGHGLYYYKRVQFVVAVDLLTINLSPVCIWRSTLLRFMSEYLLKYIQRIIQNKMFSQLRIRTCVNRNCVCNGIPVQLIHKNT